MQQFRKYLSTIVLARICVLYSDEYDKSSEIIKYVKCKRCFFNNSYQGDLLHCKKIYTFTCQLRIG